MSTLYPSQNGINNMDNMLRLTDDGIAIHKGNTAYFSHGCIHVDTEDSNALYSAAYKGLPVIITPEDYSEFL